MSARGECHSIEAKCRGSRRNQRGEISSGCGKQNKLHREDIGDAGGKELHVRYSAKAWR